MNDPSPYAAPPDSVKLAAPQPVASRDDVLAVAEFDPKVCRYWLIGACSAAFFSVVGIPLIPIIYLIGIPITKKYLETHHLELGRRELRLRKGLLTKVEKTLPLEKITDIGLVQGPLMRMVGVDGLSVETAGQTSQGALLSLQGVVNARGFRDLVLDQRDKVSANDAAAEPESDEDAHLVELRAMSATLKRIENLLDRPSG